MKIEGRKILSADVLPFEAFRKKIDLFLVAGHYFLAICKTNELKS